MTPGVVVMVVMMTAAGGTMRVFVAVVMVWMRVAMFVADMIVRAIMVRMIVTVMTMRMRGLRPRTILLPRMDQRAALDP
jgi:hypothetical protein